jgi:hypothetical protein
MEKLGYIVTKKKIQNMREFVGVVDDISLADPTKPILIIGLKEAKKYSSNFSILNKKLDDNIFWTFEKHEKRLDFERDLSYFYKYIIIYILNNIKYYYINILNLKYNNIKKLYNILFSINKKYIYISNEMIYILHDNSILGISLKILRYAGINTSKFLNKIKKNESNIICEDDSFLVNRLKKDIGNKKYIIPYFMSIQ